MSLWYATTACAPSKHPEVLALLRTGVPTSMREYGGMYPFPPAWYEDNCSCAPYHTRLILQYSTAVRTVSGLPATLGLLTRSTDSCRRLRAFGARASLESYPINGWAKRSNTLMEAAFATRGWVLYRPCGIRPGCPPQSPPREGLP